MFYVAILWWLVQDSAGDEETSYNHDNIYSPFCYLQVMLVGGSFGMKYFAQLRYTYTTRKQVSTETATS